MKNHEAEQLNDELLTETRHHSDTLRKWQKDIELNQQLRNEIATLESQNERLVKTLAGLLYLYERRLVVSISHAYFEQVEASHKEAKAVLEEAKK